MASWVKQHLEFDRTTSVISTDPSTSVFLSVKRAHYWVQSGNKLMIKADNILKSTLKHEAYSKVGLSILP